MLNQISHVLPLVKNLDPKKLCLAYEPVWAIGTGKTASSHQAVEAHRFIQTTLTEQLGGGFSTIPILYGGSVKPGNGQDLLQHPEINGALVGGASLNPESFNAICKIANEL